MGMYGNDYGYAITRLVGTIVRESATNEPVIVHAISEDGMCHCQYLEDDVRTSFIHLDNLNLKPVSLGYVNNGGSATYMRRIPKRRDWKQGLRRENCMSSSGRNIGNFPYRYLRDSIINRFPTFQRAVAESVGKIRNGNIKHIAFHRHWAVKGGKNLYYKEELVGNIVFIDEQPTVELLENKWHLKEYLEEIL